MTSSSTHRVVSRPRAGACACRWDQLCLRHFGELSAFEKVAYAREHQFSVTPETLTAAQRGRW